MLSSGAKLITFTPDGENGGHFALSSEISGTAWISLTDFADVNDDDPRKFEKLYLAGNTTDNNGIPKIDYYFGAEISATTPPTRTTPFTRSLA